MIYKPARLEIIVFETEDVIVTSDAVPMMTSVTATDIVIPITTRILPTTVLDY